LAREKLSKITSLLLMMVLRICDDGSHRLGLHRNQQLDEIGGNIPALVLGGARISQPPATLSGSERERV
jgi:hypothetical protein